MSRIVKSQWESEDQNILSQGEIRIPVQDVSVAERNNDVTIEHIGVIDRNRNKISIRPCGMLIPLRRTIDIQRNRQVVCLPEILHVRMQQNMQAIREMTSRGIDHNVSGGDQIEKVVVQEKESCGIRQRLPTREGLNFHNTKVHLVNRIRINHAQPYLKEKSLSLDNREFSSRFQSGFPEYFSDRLKSSRDRRNAKPCRRETLFPKEDATEEVLEALLIATTQKVRHCEMSTYDTRCP